MHLFLGVVFEIKISVNISAQEVGFIEGNCKNDQDGFGCVYTPKHVNLEKQNNGIELL